MATAFLLQFSGAVVGRLHAEEQLELAHGASEAEVSAWVAEFLGARAAHTSLISSLARALVACPGVEELYADDEQLRELVNDVPASVLPR